MKLLNNIGKVLIWMIVSFAIFTLVYGVVKWRIDTFLIGVLLLFVAAVMKVEEDKEKKQKQLK